MKSKKRVSYIPPKNQATQRIGNVLSTLASAREFDAKMLEQRVFALWRKVVSSPFSTNMHPVSLSGGTLKLYTEYPLYRAELLFHKQKIIADLNAELGDAVLTDFRTEIRQFGSAARNRATQVNKPPSQKTPSANLPQGAHKAESGSKLTPDGLDSIEQVLSEMSDTPLKASLRQLFITQSENNSTRKSG